MKGRRRFALCRHFFLGSLILGGSAARLYADDPTQKELLEQLKALQAEVKELKAQQKMMAASAPAAPESIPATRADKSAAADVLRDAEFHSQLLDSGDFTAGYNADRGFIIQSTDGRYLLHPWFFVQVRDASNYRQDGKANGTKSDFQNGFELRRAKLILDGNAITPDLTYQIIWAADRTTGNLQMEDAWARYHVPNTPFAFRVGQIRDPFDHEQIVYGTQSLTADRSFVDNFFAGGDGIVQGASIAYGYDTNRPVRTEIAITDGQRSSNTNFQDFPTNAADWGASGRVEWKLRGLWAQYKDFTARGNKASLLVLGAGADYTEAGDAGQLLHLVDVQFETPNGLTLYGAYLGRYVRHNAGPLGTNGGAVGTKAIANTYDSTFRAMAGYAVDPHWEPFARYEYIHFDGFNIPAGSSHETVHEITAGVNYYFTNWKSKLTGEVSYLPNGSPVADSGSDTLANKGGNEVVFRAQFQFAI